MSANSGSSSSIRISFDDLYNEFYRILIKNGFTESKAETVAKIFTENSLDGVYTHGVNRFPRFIKYIREKVVDVNAEPEKKNSAGAIEQWNGNYGPGILNALKSTDRAMELAKEYGIGCVALAYTNHWMRGGTYGWRAAKQGFAFIGWTNTLGNMPAWGATDSRLGNNPFVLGLPYNNEAIVLDMAMSLFSYGKMEAAVLKGQKLSFPGGYNKDGKLTDEPSEILETWRSLPMGYWKGAGLALLLDLLATVLSAGIPTYEIDKYEYERGLSQIFIALDLARLGEHSIISKTVNNIIDDYHASVPETESTEILYPGERVLRSRKENSVNGIPVNTSVWDEIKGL